MSGLTAMTSIVGTESRRQAMMPARSPFHARIGSPAPTACEARGSTAMVTPIGVQITAKKSALPMETAERSASETRPTRAASTSPRVISATWAKAMGTASRSVSRISSAARIGRPPCSGGAPDATALATGWRGWPRSTPAEWWTSRSGSGPLGRMRPPPSRAAAILLVVAVTSPRSAAAQAPVGDKVAAEALYEEAKVLLNEQRWQAALDKLLASQRIDPAIGTLLNIGYCYEKLNKTASAWASYNEVVGLARAAGDRQGRGERAAQAARTLEPRLSRVVVAVPGVSRVEGLEVRRDGEPLDPGTWNAAIPVDPGAHAFDATAPGRAAWRASVEGPPEPRTVTVAVPLLAPAAAWGSQRIAGAAIAGVGVAGAIAGGVFGVLTIVKKNAEGAHCQKVDADLCDATGVGLRAQALTMANASNAAFAVGGAALATGAALFFTAPKPGGGGASIGISPVASAQTGGVRITGRW